MTSNQRKHLYFPAWTRCARALGWVMASGRLDADLTAQEAEARREAGGTISHQPSTINHSPSWDLRLQVIAIARKQAAQQHRGVTADDLRHACNLIASSGHTDSSDRLKQSEINRCLVLWRLLADPDNLDTIADWDDPEDAERRSFVRFLERQNPRVHDALRAICVNRWDTSLWPMRSLDDLQWLWSKVRDRGARPLNVHQPSAINHQPS